jgi:preprotein translocase subunit SecG
MYYAVLTVHILVCIFLVIVVLLQSGKAADLAGAFGGMGSQTAFGPRGSATLLSKATTISFIVFIMTSTALSILATRGAGLATSVLEDQTRSAPVKTAPPPAPAQTPGKLPLQQLPIPAAPNTAPAPTPVAPATK